MANSFYYCKNKHVVVIADETDNALGVDLEFDVILCPVCNKFATMVTQDAPYMIAEYKYRNGQLVKIKAGNPNDFPLTLIKQKRTAANTFEAGMRFRKVEWEAEKANNAMFEDQEGHRLITSPKDFKL